MAYLALYRKYRPTGFDGVIGQDHIVKTLVNQIKLGRLGHAYLFTGTRGTGKTSLAKIFAKAINCQSPVNGSPCGKCAACLALSDPSNVDVIEIDAASNNGVNEIRDLREKVQYPPVSVKYKVYIIDEVHMLTGAAFNALLKTLEEPPSHAVFILATTEVHKIPATILSRCMRFDFKLIPTEVIAKHVAEIYDELGKPYEKEAVFAIAKAGEGSMRDALSIADTALSYSEGKLTYGEVTEILGSSGADVIYPFVKSVIGGDAAGVLTTVNELFEQGKSMNVLTRDVKETFRDLLVVKTCEAPNAILNLPEDRLKELTEIAKSTNTDRLLSIIETFTKAESDLKYSLHPRVAFETAAIKAARPEADYNIDALMGRIKTLEDKLARGEFKPVGEKAPANVSESPVKAVDKPGAGERKTAPARAEEPVKKDIKDLTAEELKGKLLYGLRKNGSEMLWNFMQGVRAENVGGAVVLGVETSDDADLIERPENLAKIKAALSEYGDVSVSVKVSYREKAMSEVDDATEKIKRIFGDDIVIVKD